MTTTIAGRPDYLCPTRTLTAAERRTAYRHHDPIAEALEYTSDLLDRADQQMATLAGASAAEGGR